MEEGTHIPTEIKSDVRKYISTDDGLKEARLQMKGVRADMKESAERIIDFMRKAGMEKFKLKKTGQCLILQEKELKIRPDSEAVKAKLRELLSSGQTDPAVLWDEVQKCGGTKTVWKLARRSKRKAASGPRKSKKKKDVPQ